jgi:hypothetical protein
VLYPYPPVSSFFSMNPNTSGRQIIQITAVSPPVREGNTSSSRKGSVIALCADGTVWHIEVRPGDNQWEQLPSIPLPDAAPLLDAADIVKDPSPLDPIAFNLLDKDPFGDRFSG